MKGQSRRVIARSIGVSVGRSAWFLNTSVIVGAHFSSRSCSVVNGAASASRSSSELPSMITFCLHYLSTTHLGLQMAFMSSSFPYSSLHWVQFRLQLDADWLMPEAAQASDVIVRVRKILRRCLIRSSASPQPTT